MDINQRDECVYIRSLSSLDAAEWVMRKYRTLPYCLSHRSWKKAEQIRLAQFYLKNSLPFVSEDGYEAFLHFMSIPLFIKFLREFVPNIEPTRLGLLLYYVEPTLNKFSKTEKDEYVVSEFIQDLKNMISENTDSQV